MFCRIGIMFVLFVCSIPAQTAPTTSNVRNNSELTQIYNEDQRVRQPKPLGPDEPNITRTDADRLVMVKRMIAENQIQTTEDYRHAAFIVQHSHDSSDYLLAHTLAIICASEGDKSCAWLSAATLDRFLQSIERPQIYGTQYVGSPNDLVTQQPYDDTLVPDTLRKRLGVPSIDAQKKQLNSLNGRKLPHH